MKVEGGCYCGAVRYKAEGDPMMVGQCHCRECQYISGGSPNMLAAMPINGFEYTKGKPKGFTRDNLERAVTREFCADCGTRIHHTLESQPDVVSLKPPIHVWGNNAHAWIEFSIDETIYKTSNAEAIVLERWK